MSNFSYTAHEQGHQLDLLGRPIKVGDRVLTKGYGSTSMNNFATVKSVNRKSISIDVEYTHWDWGEFVPRPEGTTGMWNTYPNRKLITTIKPMKRVGYTSVLVVNELEPISTSLAQTFANEHPEWLI